MKIKYVILLGTAMLVAGVLVGQELPSVGGTTQAPTMGPAQVQGPMSEKDVILALKKKGEADQLLKDVKARGVDFETDADTEKRLRKAKATDEMIAAIKAAGPKEREAAAKAAAMSSGALILPPEEAKDFLPLQTELDPDKVISLAEAFGKKYPNSEALSQAYAFEAHAYLEKNAPVKVVEYAEKSLEAKKDNILSLGMIAACIPTQQYLDLHRADQEKQLARAENYVQDAFKGMDALKKPLNESDEAFAQQKANFIADLHADLGAIHLGRARLGLLSLDLDEVAKALSEYKLAISTAQQPDPRAYYRLGDCYRILGKWDDAIAAYTKASELGQGVLKQLADGQIAAIKKAKATAGAPKP